MTRTLRPSVRSVEERNALVEQWAGLVNFVLRRLRHYPYVLRYRDECRSAAHLALLRSAELWREEGGAKFHSYAVFAMLCKVRYEAARQARRRAREVSFSAVFQVEEDRIKELSRRSPRQPEGLEKLPRLLACLTPRQRSVIEARYGLNGKDPCTVAEAAESLGVCTERARQLQQEALCRMIRRLASVPA